MSSGTACLDVCHQPIPLDGGEPATRGGLKKTNHFEPTGSNVVRCNLLRPTHSPFSSLQDVAIQPKHLLVHHLDVGPLPACPHCLEGCCSCFALLNLL